MSKAGYDDLKGPPFKLPYEKFNYESPEKNLPEYSCTPSDSAILGFLYRQLSEGASVGRKAEGVGELCHNTSFPDKCYRISLVLYAPGHKRVLIGRGSCEELWSFDQVWERLLLHPRTAELAKEKFHLQVDFSTESPARIDFFRVGMRQKKDRHFELGLDGLVIQGSDGKEHIFLPGDAFVRSIMSMQQLRSYLFAVYGEEYLRAAQIFRYTSDSYLADGETWRRLYRGYPLVGAPTKAKLEGALGLAIKHIQKTQRLDGKFLYYYDPSRDSYRDHEHPSRNPEKNPYYNILRHSGGGLTCVFYEKYTANGDTIGNIRRALDYLLLETRTKLYGDREGAYIYSEKKSKLGGAALALYLASEYQLMTGDSAYRDWTDQLAWHLVNQITDSGEFIYYNVYLDEQVTEETNRDYFSFYYPGEAISALAKYLQVVQPEERIAYFDRIRLAMHFLIEVRPLTLSDHFTVLPSDSWLMTGIRELWKFEEMRDRSYLDFVISDAQQMVNRMYTVSNAPYGDYGGSFYYEYGNYPYADGARMEGLMAAFELAVETQNVDLQAKLFTALKLGAWALLHLVNTEEACYSYRVPTLAVGGIRFKHTRQWFRIDTIQHVASFFAKLLPYWDDAERLQCVAADSVNTEDQMAVSNTIA